MKLSFSIVLIARNEVKTLPRLVKSLSEFQKRGGDIIVVDTGSTDETVAVAKALQCSVFPVGNRFVRTLNADMVKAINGKFVVEGESPIVSENQTLFDYAAARNYAASLSSRDFVAMPDCDEIFTAFSLDAIENEIRNGAERFEYNFVFSHDSFGREAIKFLHSKFYDRRKMQWVGIVHEVLHGDAKTVRFPESSVKLEHWQNPETSRAGYLPGLALDCYLHPDNDRNSHYLARDLMWSNRFKSAINEFRRHIAMNRWPAERSQSGVYIGDCQQALGDTRGAIAAYTAAFHVESGRREPLIRLAEHFWKLGDAQRTAAYASAALTIPINGFYANDMAHYTHLPHEMLYWAFWQLGDKVQSKLHWEKALEFLPTHPKFLHDVRFYMDLPKVSIVIPWLGRDENLGKIHQLIHARANYPNFEVIIEKDSFENRQGVPKTLKAGVAKATGEYIMFLGNDCEPQSNFLILAVLKALKTFDPNIYLGPRVGLVGLNDGYWENGEVATHWLAHRKLLDYLDGEFFHTGYNHVGCDNELTERCRDWRSYVWCKEARIKHNHPIHHNFESDKMDEVNRIAYSPEAVAKDRELLDKRSRKLGFANPKFFSRPNKEKINVQ